MATETKPRCPVLVQLGKTKFDSRDMNEVNAMVKNLQSKYDQALEEAAFRGDAQDNFWLALREINEEFRRNYFPFGDRIGLNIRPLIVLNDSDPGEEGIGTTITYYAKDGSIHRYSPTPRKYEGFKVLDHIVPAVFTIIAPYFKTLESTGWIAPLRKYQTKLQHALDTIEGAHADGLDKEVYDTGKDMLTISVKYIDSICEKKKLNMDEYRVYVNAVYAYCDVIMRKAVRMQAEALIKRLNLIKGEMGESDWSKTYFAVPTVWSVDGINVRDQVLDAVCTQDHLSTHLVHAQSMNVGTTDKARKVVGRVVGDRALAAATFPSSEEDLRHMYALCTGQDLLAEFANDEIKKIVTGE